VAKKADQEKKPEDTKDDVPEAHKEVNYIYGGPDSYESRRKQKLTAWEVLVVSLATPEHLKWSEVSITFHLSDHSNFVPKLGRYPLIVSPIIKDVMLNRVLVDGGSSLYNMFLKTFDQMGLSISTLCLSRALFHGIVLGAAATPVGQITLPVTFGTPKNCHTDFETAYNVIPHSEKEGTKPPYVCPGCSNHTHGNN
jgi:hypothetical protein